MNADKFAYWLQGALELNPEMLDNGMTPEQVQTIQDHLNLVFNKVTPDRFKEAEEKKELIPMPEPLNILDLDLHKGSGNPPPQHPGSTSDTLFCSTLNQDMKFPEQTEGFYISGCTVSNVDLAKDLAVHMDGESVAVSEEPRYKFASRIC